MADFNDSTLETKRFFLRILKPDLVGERYLDWLNSNDAGEYIKAKKHSLSDLKEYVSDKYASQRCLFWGVFDKESDSHIGNIKLEDINQEESWAALGILIGEKDWRGRGVAAEVMLPCFCYVRDKFKVDIIYLGVSEENSIAISAYRKFGFEEYYEYRNNDPKVITMRLYTASLSLK